MNPFSMKNNPNKVGMRFFASESLEKKKTLLHLQKQTTEFICPLVARGLLATALVVCFAYLFTSAGHASALEEFGKDEIGEYFEREFANEDTVGSPAGDELDAGESAAATGAANVGGGSNILSESTLKYNDPRRTQIAESRVPWYTGGDIILDEQIDLRVSTESLAETISYFPVVMWVNKAKEGQTAQVMRIYRRLSIDELGSGLNALEGSSNDFWVREHSFFVSTGIAKQYDTPSGVFQLDQKRMYKDYTSKKYEAEMPYAMFLKYFYETSGGGVLGTGVALHRVPKGVVAEGKLGRQASHGCIRIGLENVKELFKNITENYKGKMVPKFSSFKNGATNVVGQVDVDGAGNPIMELGVQVLLIIVNQDD